MEVQETRVQTDRVLTIPNILSMARLLGVPLFLWLILRPEFGGFLLSHRVPPAVPSAL